MELGNKANADPRVAISAVLLNVQKASDRTAAVIGLAEQFRRMIFWPKTPQWH